MKKELSITLVFLLTVTMLFGCQGKENPSSGSENSTISSESVAKQVEIITYLETDDTKPQNYKDTINAYNDFLNVETKVKDMKTGEIFTHNPNSNIDDGYSAIRAFALFDMNDDGMPELQIKLTHNYEIFSYQNNQIVRWYFSDTSFMNGPIYPLENGALFSKHISTDYYYSYITFDDNGIASELSFGKPGSDYEGAVYLFDDKKVSKAEYEQLTKEYMQLSEKQADIEWHKYK